MQSTNSRGGIVFKNSACHRQKQLYDRLQKSWPLCSSSMMRSDLQEISHTCPWCSELTAGGQSSCLPAANQICHPDAGAHLPLADAGQPVDAARHDLLVQPRELAAAAAAAGHLQTNPPISACSIDFCQVGQRLL